MMNPIQSESQASLWSKGEAQEVSFSSEKGGDERHQTHVPPARARRGGFGMFGGRMVGSWCDVKWGTLSLSHESLLVWSARMLEALERGNDKRKWHTLADKVWLPKTLEAALQAVTSKAGGESGANQKRPLGLPTVRDRIVQKALHIVLEPIFERDFAEQSYGFRPGRNARQAVERVESLLKEGKVWVVDADIKGYFDNIPHEALMERVGEKIADSRVKGMIEKFLKAGVMESGKDWEPTTGGTPQGAVISPLLANIYLDPLDHKMAAGGKEMIRYADDFVILCESREEAEATLEEVRQWTGKAGLTRHPEKTRIVDAREGGGFEFLGWHFERGLRWPREKSQKKFKESIRAKTARNNGKSMEAIIVEINRTVRGWGNYFQGGVAYVPKKLQGWMRMRLRSILRRRNKRKGRGRGRDHYRYQNAWFAERGLINLKDITHRLAESPAT